MLYIIEAKLEGCLISQAGAEIQTLWGQVAATLKKPVKTSDDWMQGRVS
jgi:hypothetical protein